MSVLLEVAHRPWPLPRSPWVLAQVWHDLLFAHWPIEVARMRAAVPAGLEVDTFEGRAWLGIVPFRMSGVRLRWSPAIPGLSAFPELNLRTYVTLGGKPGVLFFSLDATNPVAVAVARAWFRLPYFRAKMSCVREGGEVRYAHARKDSRFRGAEGAELAARYGPRGEAFRSRPGTLEHFLTERYCLYAAPRRGGVWRAEIHHPPWALQPAEASFERNTLVHAHGFDLPGVPPLLHFAERQEVLVWSPRRVA